MTLAFDTTSDPGLNILDQLPKFYKNEQNLPLKSDMFRMYMQVSTEFAIDYLGSNEQHCRVTEGGLCTELHPNQLTNLNFLCRPSSWIPLQPVARQHASKAGEVQRHSRGHLHAHHSWGMFEKCDLKSRDASVLLFS